MSHLKITVWIYVYLTSRSKITAKIQKSSLLLFKDLGSCLGKNWGRRDLDVDKANILNFHFESVFTRNHGLSPPFPNIQGGIRRGRGKFPVTGLILPPQVVCFASHGGKQILSSLVLKVKLNMQIVPNKNCETWNFKQKSVTLKTLSLRHGKTQSQIPPWYRCTNSRSRMHTKFNSIQKLNFVAVPLNFQNFSILTQFRFEKNI